MAAPVPCCALGLVEEGNRSYAFLALRRHVPIPSEITAAGFNFGLALLGTSEFEVIQFAFEFYGFETYHVLLNPSNPVVQTVVNSMVEGGEYFIFAVDSDEGVTTFRADVGRSALAGRDLAGPGAESVHRQTRAASGRSHSWSSGPVQDYRHDARRRRAQHF
jgi:hypothetical protein